MSKKNSPIIPTPTKSEIDNLWENFTPTIPIDSKSRILFVPHAALQYSGYCALDTFSTCIPKPNKIWIFGTNHRPLGIPNNTMFKNIEDLLEKPDIGKRILKPILLEDSTDALREHSIMINSALLRYQFPKVPIYPWLISPGKWLDTTIIQILTKYIVKFLKENPRNMVVFSSDMSHEDNVVNGSQTVINKEADIISDILNGILLPVPRNNYSTICGPENLALFISVLREMKEYPVIRCYDDSLGKRMFWTTGNADRIVSYLSMVSNKSKETAAINNNLWLLSFYKSFVLSSIYSQCGSISLSNPKFPEQLSTGMTNGIFITIMDKSSRTTRACIGEFFQKGLLTDKHIQSIIPRLIIDARDRWMKPFSAVDKGRLICEFTILDNKRRKIVSTLKKPNLSFNSKNNGAENAYIIQSGQKQGIFIPDVWKSNPDWSSRYYIEELLKKADISLDSDYHLYAQKTMVL
jgi:AmmeMemoRadiSam system protein B